MAERNKINTIVEGKLYQRGQILSWPRQQKLNMIEELNIGIVVNFWPKLDPDMSDMADCWYLYLPSSSEGMMDFKVRKMANAVASIINVEERAALILCEAGMTRSVFFTGLVLNSLYKSGSYRLLMEALPNTRMKTYMIDFLKELK